ncbi:hypothetical protein TorRG33x02_208520 [Trema orientale]|uniref:Uncharacterized protein n=1 Tax=Trema orientale TaxID=63057 RepID=A0A2P5ED27_TREOI|nr:hypothetical protein TorRG33x02_208520 [Trema orientale]
MVMKTLLNIVEKKAAADDHDTLLSLFIFGYVKSSLTDNLHSLISLIFVENLCSFYFVILILLNY